MRSMRMLTVALSATLAIAWAGSALADMTGTYTGYGDADGTTLELRQTGTGLNGVFGGDVEGVLLGTVTGDDATGVILFFDQAKIPFAGTFTGTELRITVTERNGDITVVPFALNRAAPAQGPTPTPPTKPAPQPAPVDPAADHAAATEALRSLLGDLMGVEFGDRPATTQAAVVECLIAATSPLSAAELRALVAAGFDPDDVMIAGFERTAPGIEDAVEACFNPPDAPPAITVAPAPIALDDAAVDATLRAVLVEVVAEVLPPDATAERRAEAVECLFLAAAGLPTAERQHLADIGFDPDEQEIARLETLLPGITQAVGTCLDFD